jgi:hypothetical protein
MPTHLMGTPANCGTDDSRVRTVPEDEPVRGEHAERLGTDLADDLRRPMA